MSPSGLSPRENLPASGNRHDEKEAARRISRGWAERRRSRGAARRSSGWLRSFHLIALIGALLAMSAVLWAATHRSQGTLSTTKSPQEVYQVLTAYEQICHKGCRYFREHLVRVRKLEYRAAATSWYTHHHLKNPLREVQYFALVELHGELSTGFRLESRQLEAGDGKLIADLENATGLRHRPAFEAGFTKTIVRPLHSRATEVNQTIILISGGTLSMWPQRIERELRESISTTFRNIES